MAFPHCFGDIVMASVYTQKKMEMRTTNADLKTQSLSQKQSSVVHVGPVPIGGPDFVVMAGPCSIEGADQLNSITRFVKTMGASVLRGGIWKMRTSVQSFQGLGAEAFGFIKQITKSFDIGLVSEVTDPRQIEMMDDLVSMYQVGSRNMHNYPLLKELGKTKKPVLLKRGFSAFVDEWLKSAEYLVAGGNDQVVLCERGIRTFETVTRNTLDLNAVTYIKENTDFPVIVDPSHAVGIRKLVPKLALAAAAAGADGIIVEVHPDPAKALSDGMQALTFDDFSNLMSTMERMLKALDKNIYKL